MKALHFQIGQRFGRLTITGLIGLLMAAICSCTIVHKPIQSNAISWDSNSQTAGVILADAKGVLVTPNWLARYDGLLANYGKTLIPPRKSGDRDGVKLEGSNYRVTYEVSDRFALLNYIRKNSLR